MPYTYRIAVTQVSDRRGNATAGDPYAFETTSHDDILEIIERARQGGYLPEGQVAAFCVGLKLLAEVVTTHRKESLFAEFWPHLGEFIRGIKSAPGEPVSVT